MNRCSFALALLLTPSLFAQTALGPTSGLPAPNLTGSAAPATVYTCDASHQGLLYKQIAANGAVTPFVCSTVSGAPTWVQEADAFGAASTVQTSDQQAFTGDVTKAAGSFATTVTGVNGAAVPASAAVLGTNSTGQLVSKTVAAQPVGENVVAFSANPTFNPNYGLNTITLTGNVTSFTLAAPTYPGTQTCLAVVQGATLGYTMLAPANVVGFMTIATALGKRNVQCFSYSASLSLWLANGPGVVGH